MRASRLPLSLLCLGLLVFAGCTDAESAVAQTPSATLATPTFPLPKGKVLKSVTPTPRSWDGKGFTEAFETAKKISTTISITDPVDWYEAAGKPKTESKPYKDAQWQTYLTDQHGLKIVVQMDPYVNRTGDIPNLPAGVRSTFADEKLRAAFIADALMRVEEYKAPIICLAMEINAYYDQHPEDFDNFVSLFSETSKAVKEKYPDTWLCVSFQYEQLLGIYGGQANMPVHEPQWELFAKFEPYADAIGISSYPFKTLSPTRHGAVDELSADYYKQMAAHTQLPIIFMELGWSADDSYGGSPESQAAFIKRLPELLAGMDVRMINYNFLYDAKGFGGAFDEMGLLDGSGKHRPALTEWNALRFRAAE